jgi:hypothetical protein
MTTALGETPNRIELIDASLLMSPARTHVTSASSDDRRTNWTRPRRPRVYVVDAIRVPLVRDMVSAGNAAADRVVKMHLYAAAKIKWYLLVEQPAGWTICAITPGT